MTIGTMPERPAATNETATNELQHSMMKAEERLAVAQGALKAAEAEVERWTSTVEAARMAYALATGKQKPTPSRGPSSLTANGRSATSRTNWVAVFESILMNVDEVERPTKSEMIREVERRYPNFSKNYGNMVVNGAINSGKLESHAGKMYLPGTRKLQAVV